MSTEFSTILFILRFTDTERNDFQREGVRIPYEALGPMSEKCEELPATFFFLLGRPTHMFFRVSRFAEVSGFINQANCSSVTLTSYVNHLRRYEGES